MHRFFQNNKKIVAAVLAVAFVATAMLGPGTTSKVFADTPTPQQASSPQVSNTGNSASGSACNPFTWGSFSVLQCILTIWADAIETVTIPILGFILGLITRVFDFFLIFSLNSANYSPTAIPAIMAGWTTIRDLMNMVFIFVLLYSAIATILDSSKYNVRQVLPRLVLAALFINFSLFITGAVIDAGNVIARGFYNVIVQNAPGQDAAASSQRSLGAFIEDEMRLAGQWDISQMASKDQATLFSKNGSALLMNSFMRVIVLCVAIYVFFSLAFIFVGRFVSIMFLLLFSPIGFMGSILPAVGRWSKKWQDELIKQTLVAPVFLIMLYVVIQVIDGFSSASTTLSEATLVDPAGSTHMAFYANYIVVIGLLFIMMKITKELSGELANKINDSLKKVATVAAGVTVVAATGGAAALGTATIGRAAGAAAQGEGRVGGTLKDWRANNEKGWRGAAKRLAGRSGLAALTRTADSSFDIRTSKLFQEGAKKTGLMRGAEVLGLSLQKKSDLDKKKDNTAKSYAGRVDARAEKKEEEVKKAAKLVGGTAQEEQRIKTAAEAAVAAAETKKDRVKTEVDRIKSDSTDTRAAAYRDIQGRTAQGTLERDRVQHQVAAAEAKVRAAQSPAERAAATTELQTLRSNLVQQTNRVTSLNQDLANEEKKLMDAVASGMGLNLDSLEQDIARARTEMNDKLAAIKTKARERLESLAKQTENKSEAYERAGTGALGGAMAGGALGSVVPGVGTVVGAAVGAGTGAVIQGARHYIANNLSQAQRKTIADKLRAYARGHEGNEWQVEEDQKKKNKKKKKGKASLLDIDALTEDQRDDLRNQLGGGGAAPATT